MDVVDWSAWSGNVIALRTAYDVQVTASSDVQFTPRDRKPGSSWPPGDAANFTASGPWHQGVPELVVTWRDSADGEERRWERVIP